MLSLAAAALSFSPACPVQHSKVAASQVQMSAQPLARRELMSKALGLAAVSVAAPAFADGANSAATVFKARSIYGSRVYRLKGATAAEILEEKNAFTLLVS